MKGIEMACKRCETRGKDWSGDDPKCAFESGIFSSDNWNCATVNELRDKVKDPIWDEDQHAGIIPTGTGIFILLCWYKRRGATDGAWLLNGCEITPLKISEAEEFLNEISP